MNISIQEQDKYMSEAGLLLDVRYIKGHFQNKKPTIYSFIFYSNG